MLFRSVLTPGGRFAFQEMAAGAAPVSRYPLPWATEPADSFLVSIDDMRALLGACGFVAERLEDVSAAHLSGKGGDAAPSPLTLGVFVDDLALKAANARRSLQDGEIRLVRGVFRAA